MKTSLIAVPAVLVAMQSFAGDIPSSSSSAPMHRYMIERTFPAGALDGVDAKVKKEVNRHNESVSVRWVQSFANPDKTKTFCIYEGPNEAAVRKAAELNKLPVDRITEVPNILLPN